MGLIKDDFPEVIKYLNNKEDAEKYTHGTVGKILCKCPDCSYEKHVEIHNLCVNGFHCDVCNDGISLPNKWIRNVLLYHNISFISEYHPPYFPKRWRVDVFIPSLNIIIEMDGDYGNHNDNVNDAYRDKLNEECGNINTIRFKLYDGLYRKNKEILVKMTVELLNIYIPNIDKTDWNFIWERSQKSLIKEVCDCYNNYEQSTIYLSGIFQLNVCTIIKYLKIGNDLGFCKYNSKEQQKKNSKPVKVTDVTTNEVKYFSSSLDLERRSYQIYGVQFKHVREIKKGFDTGKRKRYYLNKYLIESYNSCND